MLVLIVDDDFGALRAARRILHEEDTLIATDTHSALELARRHRPDVILIDVLLGNENGLDAVLPLLQASPASAVAVTSGNDDFKSEASASGAHAWVPKSAWPQLAAILSQVLDLLHGEQARRLRQ